MDLQEWERRLDAVNPISVTQARPFGMECLSVPHPNTINAFHGPIGSRIPESTLQSSTNHQYSSSKGAQSSSIAEAPQALHSQKTPTDNTMVSPALVETCTTQNDQIKCPVQGCLKDGFKDLNKLLRHIKMKHHEWRLPYKPDSAWNNPSITIDT